MSIVRQGTLPVGSLDHAITLNVQSSGGSHFETVTDTTPYLHRASPQDVASSMKLKKVVGGTIAWNQLFKELSASNWIYTTSTMGSATYSNGECTYTTTSENTSYKNGIVNRQGTFGIVGHKYLVCVEAKSSRDGITIGGDICNVGFTFTGSLTSTYKAFTKMLICTASQNAYLCMRGGQQVNDVITFKNTMLFDLTQMFGSTIADYIASLEQAHAGDGVAWFKALFGEDYYPYNAGELMSVKTSARKTYDAGNVEIGSYPLDDSLTLRGIPKLDGNNELYYDGDTYASDGTVTRRYGVVDLGTLNWQYVATGGTNERFQSSISGIAPIASPSVRANAVCANYPVRGWYLLDRSGCDKFFCRASAGEVVAIRDTTYNDLSTFKTAMSGVYLVYELATPTTESADAYTQAQRVGATEEFVDGRTVEIPVGNVSEYKRLIQGGTP